MLAILALAVSPFLVPNECSDLCFEYDELRDEADAECEACIQQNCYGWVCDWEGVSACNEAHDAMCQAIADALEMERARLGCPPCP